MRKALFLFALISFTALAQAPALPQDLPITPPVIDNPDLLTGAYQALVGQWSAAIQPLVYEIYGVLAFIELSVFGILFWRDYRGDPGTVAIGVSFKLLALGLYLTIIQLGPQWMAAIINTFTDAAKTATGMPALYPSTVIGQGSTIAGVLLDQADNVGGLFNMTAGLALVFCAACIFIGFLVIACQMVIFKIATFVVLAAGMISLAFGGSRWTVNFVERYMSTCFMIGFRLFFIYFMVSAGWQLTDQWITMAKTAANSGNAIQLSFVLAGQAAMFSLVCWFIPALCSSMMTGSVSLGHGEIVSTVATMVSSGVAMGMVAGGMAAKAVAGGASAVTGGAKIAAGGGSASGRGGWASPSGGASSSGSGSKASGAGKGATASKGAGVAAGAAKIAQIGLNTARSMPSGGHHAPPPHIGLGH